MISHQGCAALFGWNIHAPGLMSAEYAQEISQEPYRVSLYIPEGMTEYFSKDRGNWHSDPQNYYIGEAFVPMLVEAFQHGFSEFILMETDPTPAIMQQYGIQYLIVVDIKGFDNVKRRNVQHLEILTETTVFNPDLSLKARYLTKGGSAAPKVFGKKGGPEVNLNHAIESNLRSVITYLHDYLRTNS